MKELIIIRHARKNVKGEGNVDLINEEALNDIEIYGVPGLNEIIKDQTLILHSGSAFERTKQTITAFSAYMANCGDSYHFDGWLPSDIRFGNEDDFAKFMANEKIVADAKATNWFNAFSHHNPNFIKRVQSEMVKAVEEIFSVIDPGTTVIMVGHTPLIEWLAYAFDPMKKISRDTKLKELDGFIFCQNSDGEIKVTGTVGF